MDLACRSLGGLDHTGFRADGYAACKINGMTVSADCLEELWHVSGCWNSVRSVA